MRSTVGYAGHLRGNIHLPHYLNQKHLHLLQPVDAHPAVHRFLKRGNFVECVARVPVVVQKFRMQKE
jgi:hypothetical protein